MERVLGSIPKCQWCKCFDFYFLFALVSVNFYGFCWLGEGDLEMCGSWLLIFDFVSAICLPYGFWKKVGNISWWILKIHDMWEHSLCLHILCTTDLFSLWTTIQRSFDTGFWYYFAFTSLFHSLLLMRLVGQVWVNSTCFTWADFFCHVSRLENMKAVFSLCLHS